MLQIHLGPHESQYPFSIISAYCVLHTALPCKQSLFKFYYPPSSGIFSCVGTVGMVTCHLHLTRPCCVALGQGINSSIHNASSGIQTAWAESRLFWGERSTPKPPRPVQAITYKVKKCWFLLLYLLALFYLVKASTHTSVSSEHDWLRPVTKALSCLNSSLQ